MSPYEFVNRIFEAKAARNGGVVRRKIKDVERYASLKYLIKEVDVRRFHLIRTGDQYVIICNMGELKLLR